jgi:hypothetical protein
VNKPGMADLVAHLALRTRAIRQSPIDVARKRTDRNLGFLPGGAEPEGSVVDSSLPSGCTRQGLFGSGASCLAS